MPRASLAALAFGNFIIGTGTLIVPGMLPQLAEGLGVSLPIAGQLITAFAITVCVAAPLLAGALGWIECRRVAGHDVSTHTFFVAHVERAEPGPGAGALSYLGGAYHAL